MWEVRGSGLCECDRWMVSVRTWTPATACPLHTRQGWRRVCPLYCLWLCRYTHMRCLPRCALLWRRLPACPLEGSQSLMSSGSPRARCPRGLAG